MLINILLVLVILSASFALTFPLIERNLFEGEKPFNLQSLYAKAPYIALNALAFASIALGVAEAYVYGHIGSAALLFSYTMYVLIFGVFYLIRTALPSLVELGSVEHIGRTRSWWLLFAKLQGIFFYSFTLNGLTLLSAIHLLK